jgi:RNA ligase (TIGR02306 family)
MARHLATIQTVQHIRPIAQADKLETLVINGWQVAAPKGLFEVGQQVIFIETDSLLDTTKPQFAFLDGQNTKTCVDENGVKHTGSVLKTRKLRGFYSQGLVLPISDFDDELASILPCDNGTDVSKMLGIYEYEPPLPFSRGEIIGKFDSTYAPKTDAERLQNLSEYWDEIRTLSVEPSVKVDGASTTIVRDNHGDIHVYSRNWELSDQSMAYQVAKKQDFFDYLENGMAVQAELVGPGIQGNRLELPKVKLLVFDVWFNHWKLWYDIWPWRFKHGAAVRQLGPEWLLKPTLEESLAMVDGLRGYTWFDHPEEGIVYHVVEGINEGFAGVSPELVDALGGSMNFKILNREYLAKNGE